MCGFVGLISRGVVHHETSSTRLARGLEWLRRRGPDSQRCWQTVDGQVGLAFARLAIVDQDAAAHQPFTSPDTHLSVVFNGEVYNYLELRGTMQNFPFRTQSDTEVILATFATWGVTGLRNLRGMFAGAIVDSRARRVYLFRDPIGKKPLYVSETRVGVAFGSSVLAIHAVVDGSSRLSDEAAGEFWKHGYVLPPGSMLDSCRSVMPGEVLEYDWETRLVRSHSCQPLLDTPARASPQEVHAECARLIEQAVARRLHNNPSPVSLLSGGIDSTVIAQSVSRLIGAGNVTLASRLRLSPDQRYARYAARRMHVPLQEVRIPLRSIADEVRWAISLQDEPLGMISFFMLAELVKSAKAYGRILLTGDGGDEVFLGYGQASDWVAKATTGPTQLPGEWTVGPELPVWMSEWGRFAVRQQLLGHMLPKVDRAAAEQGVETRSPLLDWDLVSFVRTLPPSLLLGGGRMKALLKSQLEGWPEWFIERPKVGFTFHLRWLWLACGFEGIRELVSIDAVREFELLLPLPLRAEPRNWPAHVIFREFATVWKLVAWSGFQQRMAEAGRSNS